MSDCRRALFVVVGKLVRLVNLYWANMHWAKDHSIDIYNLKGRKTHTIFALILPNLHIKVRKIFALVILFNFLFRTSQTS